MQFTDGSTKRGVGVRLFVAAVVLASLFTVGTFAERKPDFDAFFGVEAYRELPLAAFGIALFLLFSLLLIPGLSNRLAELFGRIGSSIPRPVRLPFLLILAALAFWFLRNVHLSGDNYEVIFRLSRGEVYASNALTCWIFIATAWIFRIDAATTIRIIALASGLAYVVFAWRIGKDATEEPAARIGLTALLLTAGTVALYFGTMEVYAPVSAAILCYLWLGIRTLRHGQSILWPALAVGVAFGLHGSGGLLLPSLAFLANDSHLRPFRWKRIALAGLGFLLPVVIVFFGLYLGTWGGTLPDAGPQRYGSFMGGGQSVVLPLVKTHTNVMDRYAIFDLEHVIGVANLALMAAPAGLALLFAGGLCLHDRVCRWVALAAASLVVFPVFWNINYSLRRDWDLFSSMGIPLTLLAGLCFFARDGSPKRLVSAVAIGLFAFIPMVWSNTGTVLDKRNCAGSTRFAFTRARAESPLREPWRIQAIDQGILRETQRFAALDPLGVDDRVMRGFVAAYQGDLVVAEAMMRRALDDEPRNPRALAGLGTILVRGQRWEEAIPPLTAALIEEPWLATSWWDLATISEQTGDEDSAIRYLEIGIRTAPYTEGAGQAMVMLAGIWERRGKTEIADALYSIAASRGFPRRESGDGVPR